jgi:hypothetical protein
MKPEDQPAETPAAVSRGVWLPTLLRATGAAALIAIAAVTYAHLAGGGTGLSFTQGQKDAPSDAERQRRISAFAAQGALTLRSVEDANVSLALDTMELSPSNKRALLADVESPALPATEPLQSAQAPRLAPEPLSARHTPLRLAWITLWDTDVEDGDVVRIDSQGYSRTVALTKRGVTFAVPVPTDGIITVTGINDGDGGGITVGLASGAAKAVFPIMSPGQSLGLSVTIK